MHCFWKQKSYIGLVILLALSLLSGCTQAREAAESSVQEESIAATKPERQPKEGIQTLLVICLDSFEAPRDSGAYRNGNKADLIMVMVIDEARGKTTALQLNPDTIVSFTVPGTSDPVDMPLGLVYSYGSGGSDSCLSGSKAVSKLLGGVPIDHYMTFTTDSIAIVNDMIGGVTVTVTEDFPKNYPQFAEGENVMLLGEDSVAFFRFRADEDIANEAHMERQRQYMSGMFAPFMEKASQENFLTQLTLQLGDALSTDLTLSQMVQMLETLGVYELDETILTLQGNAEKADGEFRFYVSEESLEQTVNSLFFLE